MLRDVQSAIKAGSSLDKEMKNDPFNTILWANFAPICKPIIPWAKSMHSPTVVDQCARVDLEMKILGWKLRLVASYGTRRETISSRELG